VALGGTLAAATDGTRQWREVLGGAVATMIATAAVVFYNDGWHVSGWRFGAAPTLVVTLMLVPLAGVALAGAGAVRRPRPGSRLRRAAAWATVACSVVCVAAMILPYLASWGPVLMLVAVAVGLAAVGGAVAAWRSAGDPAVEERFRGYVATNHTRLLATAYLLCGDRAEADRLVGAVLTRVFLAWRRLADPAAVDTYTRRALVHGAARVRPPADRDPVYRLPARERAALVLTLHDGLTPAEVADALDCPPDEVRRLTARALEHCAT